VRSYDGASQTYEYTSQLFFSETTIAQAYSVSPSSGNGMPDTPNAADGIYAETGGTSGIRVRLMREGRTIASERFAHVRRGTPALGLAVGSDVAAGPALLVITARDSGSAERTIRRRVRVPARERSA
jgi:hypothetical protein